MMSTPLRNNETHSLFSNPTEHRLTPHVITPTRTTVTESNSVQNPDRTCRDRREEGHEFSMHDPEAKALQIALR